VRALYRAALERPAADRASFVADLTGDDVDLRRSVELLLSSHDATAASDRAAAATPGAELPAGTVISHYRIDAVIGRGGMGVVYRATDQKLHRPVAIKFLAAAVPDANVRRRFEQEAKTTSGLNHPHIVTVLDVDEHEGQQYIVSELVDGGTLDEWADKHRSRTWRQSVELLTGVADALAAAHSAGVLHRDVKPGNILIGSNGYAKLADFGLAKLVRPEPTEPLKASHNTRAGLVIGTVAYMSPEQASGEALDARSDVFSFGIVLYELLAGRAPFAGTNELETLKSIAHAIPAALPEAVPEPLQALVEKALEKAPADRYQTMQDLVVDLKRLTRKQGSTQAASPMSVDRRRARAWSLTAAALAVALATTLVPAATHLLEPSAEPIRPIHFDISVPGLAANGLAVTPNGEQIAYVAAVDGVRQIWARSLDSAVARPLPGTDGAAGIFAAPDSRRIAFTAAGKLKTIEITGGPPTVITDYESALPLHGAWTEDASIIFPLASGTLVTLARVAAAGGTPTVVRTPETARGELVLTVPQALPDQGLIYAAGSPTGGDLDLYAVRPANGEAMRLLTFDNGALQQGILPGAGFGTGHLLYRRGGTLLAHGFDAATLELRGDAVPIAENVAEFAVADKLLVYRTAIAPLGSVPAQTRRLVWRDRTGERLGELEAPPQVRAAALSPDARSVAVSDGALPFTDIWTVDALRGVATRVTFAESVDDIPAWSPDSTRIVFNSGRDGEGITPTSLYARAANGTGPEELVLRGGDGELLVPFDWSRDGRYLIIGRASIANFQQRMDLWLVEMTGERVATPLIESPFRKEMAKFSPDGRWIAYTSTEGGRQQIFVQSFPDLTLGKWPISTRGGREARWRGDSNELFYVDLDGNLMAVDLVVDGEQLAPGQPRLLFDLGFEPPGPNALPDIVYNVAPDGQRFLITEPIETVVGPAAGNLGEPSNLHVIVNWAEGLSAR
jgi:serine/threonine protein kinase/Tol biopolymer transport system component